MEKYNQIYEQLSALPPDPKSDSEKLRLLTSLLTIHANYSQLKKYAAHNYFNQPESDSNAEFRHGSFILSRATQKKSSKSFFLFSRKKICKFYLDLDEEVEMIKFTFEKITRIFHDGDQNETKNKLFLPYLVQFLLDCYTITQHFMSLFLLPLNKERWVDSEKFLLSLESIQQMSFERASFFYQEPNGDFKKNVALQKVIFFFKLVEFCCGSDLTEADLACVLSMSLRNNKKEADSKKLAKNIFDRLQKMNRGVVKHAISFEEFHKLLISNHY